MGMSFPQSGMQILGFFPYLIVRLIRQVACLVIALICKVFLRIANFCAYCYNLSSSVYAPENLICSIDRDLPVGQWTS